MKILLIAITKQVVYFVLMTHFQNPSLEVWSANVPMKVCIADCCLMKFLTIEKSTEDWLRNHKNSSRS